jgi:hypothetical protein
MWQQSIVTLVFDGYSLMFAVSKPDASEGDILYNDIPNYKK